MEYAGLELRHKDSNWFFSRSELDKGTNVYQGAGWPICLDLPFEIKIGLIKVNHRGCTDGRRNECVFNC